MKTSELIYIGIKGSVVALNRSTGEQLWTSRLRGSDFVNVLLDDERVLAVTYGEVYCLNPITGQILWHNPLRGYGVGLATIATSSNIGSGTPVLMAEKRRREQQDGATAAVIVSTTAAT